MAGAAPEALMKVIRGEGAQSLLFETGEEIAECGRNVGRRHAREYSRR
jgi:hypothetical protein